MELSSNSRGSDFPEYAHVQETIVLEGPVFLVTTHDWLKRGHPKKKTLNG